MYDDEYDLEWCEILISFQPVAQKCILKIQYSCLEKKRCAADADDEGTACLARATSGKQKLTCFDVSATHSGESDQHKKSSSTPSPLFDLLLAWVKMELSEVLIDLIDLHLHLL